MGRLPGVIAGESGTMVKAAPLGGGEGTGLASRKSSTNNAARYAHAT